MKVLIPIKHNFGVYFCIVLSFLASSNVYSQADISKDSQALDLNKIQGFVTDIKSENEKLETRLKKLEGSVTKDNFTKVLKQANIEKFKSDMNILEKRYEAGEDVLYHIIKETNHFNSTYKHLSLQPQFSNLINPRSYPEFTTPLIVTLNSLKDKKPMPDIAQDLSNISSIVPYLSNPIINSSLSIVSYFIAKYNKKSEVDNLNYNKMMCILNFVTKAENEYGRNILTTKSLTDKIEKYNKKLKEFLDLYLKSVNYNAGYDSYISDKTKKIGDVVGVTRASYFNSILSDTTKIGIINYKTVRDDNISFYIEQVKFQLGEYEALLLDIDNSINSYEVFVEDLSKIADSSCDIIKNQTKPNFDKIRIDILEVKKAFEAIKTENRVPADQIVILFGL